MKLTLVSCFFLLVLLSCKQQSVGLDIEEKEVPNEDQFQEMTINYNENGHIKATINAPIVKRSFEGNKALQVFEGGVKAYFYNADTVSSELEADRAYYDEKEKKVTALDNVIFQNKQGEELKSNELIWSQKTGKIETNRFVTVKRNQEIIYGHYGLESDQNFQHVTIRKGEGRTVIDNNSGI